MSAVLDTTVLIDVLRAQPAAVNYVLSLSAQPVCSEISRVEVIRGMQSPERMSTFRLLASLDWHPVDAEVAIRSKNHIPRITSTRLISEQTGWAGRLRT